MQPIASRSDADGGALLPAGRRAAPGKTSPLKRAGRWVRRMTFLLHRWIGIAIALLMAVWAVSGVVMMYVSFPETTSSERLAGLPDLEMGECCSSGYLEALEDGAVEGASVEMLVDRPVLRWSGPDGPQVIDLTTGETPVIDASHAGRIASSHYREATGAAAGLAVETIDRDQWTVYGRFRQHRPLYKASFGDAAGTVLYVSGLTGEVVQDTTAHERFWNWLGAVPHWLYFTAFREIQWLWYDFVVYTSVLGTFLTVTGIYIGLRQYGRGKTRSPYRGAALWHHWTGLIFGIFALTWVVSGLFSMQPWGWFESEGPEAEHMALAERPATSQDVAALVRALTAQPAGDTVRAELTVQGGAPFAILADAHSGLGRASLPSLTPSPPGESELARRAQLARPADPIAGMSMITRGDAYHYAHKQDVILPAWRTIYSDEEQTRLYFDPRTAEAIRKVDAEARAYRWLHYGLHRLDFPGLRTRPVWDIVTLPLMLGVSLLCLTGCWMGWRRLTRTKKRRKTART